MGQSYRQGMEEKENVKNSTVQEVELSIEVQELVWYSDEKCYWGSPRWKNVAARAFEVPPSTLYTLLL